jgi:hypothetical protein
VYALHIETDQANFSVCNSIINIDNLLIDSSLQALHSTDIGDLLFSLQELVRAITKLHEFFPFYKALDELDMSGNFFASSNFDHSK